MKNMKQILLILGCLFWVGILAAQKAYVKADKYRFRLGEEVELQLHAAANKNVRIIWPQTSDSLGSHIDILRKGNVDTVLRGDSFYLSQKLFITSFDSGMYSIPIFPFQFIDASGDTSEELSESLRFQILTVPVDTTQAIKPIREIMDIPFEIGPYIPWILGVLAGIVLIIGIIVYVLKKRKPAEVLKQNKPIIPPWIRALELLQKHASSNYIQQGKIKDYYAGISDIVRGYFEERYEIPAMESVTDEIMRELEPLITDDTLKREILNLLRNADMVKFAKMIPPDSLHLRTIEQAKQIIELSKPEEKRLSEEKGGNADV
jgi:hypothetical protein